MTDRVDNPIDDDLMKELGLEPKVAPSQTKSTQTSIPQGLGAAKKAQPPKPKPPVAPQQPIARAPQNTLETSEPFDEGIKNVAQEMPVQVVAVLGKKTMTLKEVIALKQGEFLELNKLPQESIDLVANGKLLARGELVLIDGKLGLHIKQLVK